MPAGDRRTPRRVDIKPPPNGLPPIIGLTVAAVVAYLVAESALADQMHPLHWLVAMAGALAGLGAGYAVAWAMNR